MRLLYFLLFFPFVCFAQDMGYSWGSPRTSFYAYLAHYEFARVNCSDIPLSEKFADQLKGWIGARHYLDESPEFSSGYRLYLSEYMSAWEAAGDDERSGFCAEYSKDVDSWFAMSRFKRPVLAYSHRIKLSPPSKAAMDRRQVATALVGLSSAVIANVAAVSASRDAVRQAEKGDFLGSNDLMALSKDYLELGPSAVGALEAADEIVTGCPVVSYFESLVNSGVVRLKYQPVSLLCD